MQNTLHPEAVINWNDDDDAPTSGNPAQPPTTHCTIQPPGPPQFEPKRTARRIDADLIESVMVDPRVRINLLLDESDSVMLPMSRKVFREAVAGGLLRLVRDDAGQVVKIENSHQELSIEAVKILLSGGEQIIGSYPGTSGNPCGDSEVDWTAIFSNYNDGLNLAERRETMAPALATWAGGRPDADMHMHTSVHGPGPTFCRYGGGSAAAQL
ncbi:hypothetical protein LXA43DRAFT_531739 [Ganoderma leucocontextum]|nr:hypothetical protein LXA43DRAFT_531739 [Ganoderma leucocontextum]